MASEIFLSHASVDAARPEFGALITDIERWGASYWVDRELTVGFEWWQEIIQQIQDCQIFIPAVSLRWLTSTACQREYTWARATDRLILPVQLESVQSADLPDFMRDLLETEMLDFSSATESADAGSLCTSKLGIALTRLHAQTPRPLPAILPSPPDLPPAYTDVFNVYLDKAELTREDQKVLLDLACNMVDDVNADRTKLRGILQRIYDTRQDVISARTTHVLEELLQRLNIVEENKGGAFYAPEGTRWATHMIQCPDVDVFKVAQQLRGRFESDGMEATILPTTDHGYAVQCRSRASARMTGAGAQLTTVLRKQGTNLVVQVGGERWSDKKASAVGATAATLLTGGWGVVLFAAPIAGARRQKALAKRTVRYLEESAPLCTRVA